MSVDLLGTRLLEEVHKENLKDLLSEVRQSYLPYPTTILGFSPLDALLEIFRVPSTRTTPLRHAGTSPVSFLSDEELNRNGATQTPARQSIPHERRPAKPAVIELTSARSGSGRSSLLSYLTAISTFPDVHAGKGSTVVWIDTDGRFSVPRLHGLFQEHISRSSPGLTIAEQESVAKEALRHVHVFRPQTSAQLTATLCRLPAYLLDTSKHVSGFRPLGILVLDSATAFYWQDRFEADIARLEAGRDSRKHLSDATNPAEVIACLKVLQRQFGCTIMFTTASSKGSRSARSNVNSPAEPAAMNQWTTFATLTLDVSRVAVPQFAPIMSTEECLRDRRQRADAMEKGRHVAGVDWNSSENWQTSVREAVSKLDGRGSFGFRVTGGGVETV